MSDDIKAPGFKVRHHRPLGYLVTSVRVQASELIAALESAFSKYSDAEKQAQIKKVYLHPDLDETIHQILLFIPDQRHFRAPSL